MVLEDHSMDVVSCSQEHRSHPLRLQLVINDEGPWNGLPANDVELTLPDSKASDMPHIHQTIAPALFLIIPNSATPVKCRPSLGDVSSISMT